MIIQAIILMICIKYAYRLHRKYANYGKEM